VHVIVPLIVACVHAGGCALITLALARVADLLGCMHALLHGLPDGRPGRDHA